MTQTKMNIKNHTGPVMNNENSLQHKQKIEKNYLSSSYNNNVLKLCISSLDIKSRKKKYSNQILENKN